MREELIVVRPFQFLDYMEVKGCQGFGRHGTLKLVGHISPEKEQEYLQLMMEETWVHVDAATYDGIMKHMFKGIILDADIRKTGGSCVMTLVLVTGSYLMDIVKHTRSFQDNGIIYDVMLNTITEGYVQSAYRMTVGRGKSIPGFLLQYEETDWAFAGRLASHFGTDIYPDAVTAGVRFVFGEPEPETLHRINTNEYSVVKRNGEICRYSISSREIFCLGDWVELNGKRMWISEVETELIGSELYHVYQLAPKQGIKTVCKYNEHCTGAALFGTVMSVEKDQVKVVLEKDENKGGAGTRWFPYATPYSSPDGTGWYCMPEPGDRIRLQIPSQDEGDAYIVSSIHMESTDGEERQNPDYKSIMNKQGKEILLTPQSLIMTNNNGMSIEILDNEGIRITSDKNLTLQASDSIEITSASSKLELYAKENIILQQGNTQMNMDGEMRMYGARLNLN